MARRLYTVQGGDSLSIIARDVLGDIERWPEIAYINSIEPPYLIRTGEVLELPNNGEPLSVMVVRGQRAPTVRDKAAVAEAGFQFTPATVTALLIAAFVVYSLYDERL